ncbi:hypothetical protein BFD69_24090 [Escherichia coli]|nr:hypothetical protein BFD69_24090 [Escherichia coli]
MLPRYMRMIAGKVMMDRNAPDYLLDTAESSYHQSKGPGDRSGSPYLATRPQKPGYDGGTAQPAHGAEAT